MESDILNGFIKDLTEIWETRSFFGFIIFTVIPICGRGFFGATFSVSLLYALFYKHQVNPAQSSVCLAFF